MLLLLATGAALLLGCQGGGDASQLVGPASVDFQLAIDDETYIEGGNAAGFKLTTEYVEDEAVVTIAVEGADNLKALMFGLSYDPLRFDPQSITMTGALDPQGGEVIEIPELLQSNPGRVEYGQILPWPGERDGLTGDAALAVARFKLQPDLMGKTSSMPPFNRRSQAPLGWDDETATLSWYHHHSGDFTQDGYVTVADLTPFAQNYDRSTGGGPWPETEHLSMIDYDSNGEINIADMAALARYFETTTYGYSIYTSLSLDDYPTGGTEPNGPGTELLGSISFVEGVFKIGESRAAFDFTVSEPQPGAYYWIRPHDGATDGTPSTVAGGPVTP